MPFRVRDPGCGRFHVEPTGALPCDDDHRSNYNTRRRHRHRYSGAVPEWNCPPGTAGGSHLTGRGENWAAVDARQLCRRRPPHDAPSRLRRRGCRDLLCARVRAGPRCRWQHRFLSMPVDRCSHARPLDRAFLPDARLSATATEVGMPTRPTSRLAVDGCISIASSTAAGTLSSSGSVSIVIFLPPNSSSERLSLGMTDRNASLSTAARPTGKQPFPVTPQAAFKIGHAGNLSLSASDKASI